MRPRMTLLLLAVLGACESAAPPAATLGPEIPVLVQTDLTPGVEIAVIEAFTRVGGGPRENTVRRTVAPELDWASDGREVLRLSRAALEADEEGAEPPATDLALRALDRSGRLTLHWETRVSPGAERIEARLLRSCQGIRCSGGTHCLGGGCVAADCFRGDEPSCPPPRCAADTMCRGMEEECDVVGRCDAGVCFRRLDSRRCGANQACVPGRGCLADPGAGLSNGERCATDTVCASGVCARGVCCNRACGTCENCFSGVCEARPGMPSEPSPEVCDALDNDCNGLVDDLLPTSDADCGACGFPCASDEVCGGQRCNLPMPCLGTLGLPCDEVEVARLTAPWPHEEMRFGARLAADGDLLAVGAPDEGTRAIGIDPAPAEVAPVDSSADFGAVHLFRRDAGGWRFEATLRPPGPMALLRPDTRYGTFLAVHGDRVAIAGAATEELHLYTFDGTAWAGPEVRTDVPGPVRALAFLDDGRLVTWREGRLVVEADAAHDREVVRTGRAATMAAQGQQVALVELTGNVLVFAPEAGLELVGPAFTRGADPVVALDGSRLYVAEADTLEEGQLRVFAREPAGWEWLQTLGADRSPYAAMARVGPFLAVGSPNDGLTDTPDPVGTDVRIRRGRARTNGSVFLYPLGAGGTGLPIDAPLYVRPTYFRSGIRFGASLATDGEVLFIGAPGDRAARPGASAERVTEAGAVFVRRVVPAAP